MRLDPHPERRAAGARVVVPALWFATCPAGWRVVVVLTVRELALRPRRRVTFGFVSLCAR